MTKEEIIDNIFYDKSGNGSIVKTFKDAKHIDNTITDNDVKDWFDKNIENKRQIRGMNSFIANHSFQEFQIDILFFSDLKDKFAGGLLLVDIFSKYIQVIPIHGKTTDEILDAIVEGIRLMHGKPEVI